MIYLKITKKIILDFLLDNSLNDSIKTINDLNEHIQQTNAAIDFKRFQDLKKKIKTTLCSLKNSFKKVKSNQKLYVILKIFVLNVPVSLLNFL